MDLLAKVLFHLQDAIDNNEDHTFTGLCDAVYCIGQDLYGKGDLAIDQFEEAACTLAGSDHPRTAAFWIPNKPYSDLGFMTPEHGHYECAAAYRRAESDAFNPNTYIGANRLRLVAAILSNPRLTQC